MAGLKSKLVRIVEPKHATKLSLLSCIDYDFQNKHAVSPIKLPPDCNKIKLVNVNDLRTLQTN